MLVSILKTFPMPLFDILLRFFAGLSGFMGLE